MSWWRWHENPPGRRDIFVWGHAVRSVSNRVLQVAKNLFSFTTLTGWRTPLQVQIVLKKSTTSEWETPSERQLSHTQGFCSTPLQGPNYHHFSLNNFSYHFLKILPQLDLSTFRHFGACWWASQVLMGGLSYGHMLTHLDLSSTSQIISFWGCWKSLALALWTVSFLVGRWRFLSEWSLKSKS